MSQAAPRSKPTSKPTSTAHTAGPVHANPLTPTTTPSTEPPLARPIAVIDIGATAIRMAIAEIDQQGQVRILDRLVQPVQLGRDTFYARKLSRKSIEQVVSILDQYQRVLSEYGITNTDDIRVVATSAVREASNQLAFIDRIFIETGLEIQPVDEAEINRITYMGITPQLLPNPTLANSKTMILEVGGGSTEVLVVRSGNVLASKSFRLGSLRMQQSTELARTSAHQRRAMLENLINRTIPQMGEYTRPGTPLNMIAIGGDIRFAARLINSNAATLADDPPPAPAGTLSQISVADLEDLADDVLQLSAEAIVKRYQTTFVQAQTLGPALLAYVRFAKHIKLTELYVSDMNLRDGLLRDIASQGTWSDEFRNQIVRSALSLGRRFQMDEMHARTVAELAKKLFVQLSGEHKLGGRHEVLLYVASLLHEVGMLINTRSHHKHTLYIIKNSEIFGLSKTELLQVGLIARYYRRASPQASHTEYMALDRDRRIVVSKLAAILRLASALDDTRTGRVRDVVCEVTSKQLLMTLPGIQDVSIEQVAIKQLSGLFRDVFGLTVVLRNSDQ
ncbi:Exopolyphosphatase [Stieleria bergensis]|uniref:Exopolyphosphatase n=1 Tax=Stieleria bergensis TaxID=2528025 RepID=A0A517STQ3_9BACT|nr:Exopolyphosphatase [Planctomycetes bacterium SV_7m_r]